MGQNGRKQGSVLSGPRAGVSKLKGVFGPEGRAGQAKLGLACAMLDLGLGLEP